MKLTSLFELLLSHSNDAHKVLLESIESDFYSCFTDLLILLSILKCFGFHYFAYLFFSY